MAALRNLFRKYWIIVIILLWVIAWVNRDRLAGNPPPSPTVAEEPAAHESGAAAATEANGAAAAPRAALPPAEAVPGMTAIGGSPGRADPAVTTADRPAVMDREPVVSEPSARRQAAAADAAVGETAVSAEPPVAGPMGGTRAAQAVVAAAESVIEPVEVAPVSGIPQPAAAAVSPAAPVSGAELLAQARTAYRNRGPRAAADVLSAGVRKIPADAPERADLLGELGNFHFGAGDIPHALAAYEEALRALPEEARAPMLWRLAPLFDRFHPFGRSQLDQFR